MSVPFFYALHDLLYPDEGYSDPNTIIFDNSRDEAFALGEEGRDRMPQRRVVRPVRRDACAQPAQDYDPDCFDDPDDYLEDYYDYD